MTDFKIPPGPSGRLRCAIGLARDPVVSVRKWRSNYGRTFRIPMFPVDYVVTCDPELVQQIHRNKDEGQFLNGVSDAIDPLFGPRSLLRLADDKHRRERKIMLPPFHGERLRGWAQSMAQVAHKWFSVGESPVKAMDLTRRVTLEVILRLVFGVHDDARVARFQSVIEDWTAALHPSFIFIPALANDFFGLSRYARYRKHSERLDAMLYEQIAAVRAATEPTDDVLTMLVRARYDDGSAMDDLSLRDNLRTLLFAGHDTTAITLAWALWFLHRDKAVLARLRDELDALGPDSPPEALSRVAYLNAVVDETLRMRPINPETQRRLARPFTLGEWTLPSNVFVGVNMVLLHYEPDLWPQPYRFNPDRFLGAPPSPSIYAPFGGGDRRCLGAAFARYEAAVVLGTVLRELDFEILDKQVEWNRGSLILEPMGGIRLRVRPRKPARQAA